MGRGLFALPWPELSARLLQLTAHPAARLRAAVFLSGADISRSALPAACAWCAFSCIRVCVHLALTA